MQGPRLHCARPFEDLGDYPTLAGLVCVAKEAARQYAERPHTRVVPTSAVNGYGVDGRFLAQYHDPAMKVWFDIGDPHTTKDAADAAAAEYLAEQVKS